MPTCFRSGRRYGAAPCPGFTGMWHVRFGNGYLTAFGCDARGLRMQVLRRVYMSRRVGATGCFPSPVIGAVVVATSFFRSGSRPRRSPAWTPRAGSSWLGAWDDHTAQQTQTLCSVHSQLSLLCKNPLQGNAQDLLVLAHAELALAKPVGGCYELLHHDGGPQGFLYL